MSESISFAIMDVVKKLTPQLISLTLNLFLSVCLASSAFAEASPLLVSDDASVDVAGLEEAVGWIRDTRYNDARYEYSVTGKIRLLFFWVGRDDVGGGFIRLARGESSPELEAIQVMFGSDPEKAPRNINRWGAATEVVRYAPGGSHIVSSAFWGFMKDSKGNSVKAMEAELADEDGNRQYEFKANLSRVDRERATSMVIPFMANEDFSIHQFGAAEATVLSQFRAPEKPPKRLDGELRGKCGRVEGFLFTIRSFLEDSLSGSQTPLSTCYIFNAKLYSATLNDVDRISEKKIKVKLHGEKKPREKIYRDLVEARFTVVDMQKGKKSKFKILMGARGELRGVPIRIEYQPNFWFKVLLHLHPDTPAPGAIASEP